MCTVCSNCGGADIEYDQSRGDAVCVQCGSVLEDNIIVSEVSFQEQSSGATSVIGQFVSSEGQNSASLSGSGFHHGMGKGSREITLMNAKRRIAKLGNMMKLNQHCIDSAFTFFKMALNLNLTKGRKASLVDTACLYMVCRTEGTPHLLLDFSDVLQINVYALGRAFLRLSDALHINPPAIDPCLYIHRFAHKLELGDKEHEVSKTALRLVARMKRDWLHHGRRPSGLCGAALLVAARLHNFNRTIKEVSKVVKVNQATIRNRLLDFKDTPSSRLTIEDFLQINLEQEHDPPSYSEARKKPKITTNNEPEAEEVPTRPEHSLLLNSDLLNDSSDTFLNTGINLQSVENTIAKAQATEQFRSNIIPSLGLGGDLPSLAKYAEEMSEGDATQLTNGEDSTELDLTEIDDTEINAMLLGPDEVEMKSKIWHEENGSFLKEQEERRQRHEEALAAQGVKKKRNYKKRKQVQPIAANSAGEAIHQMLVEKKISSKINYDVLRELSDENSTQEPKVDSNTTPSVEATPATPSSAPRKRTFSLLDSGGSASTINRNVSSYHSTSTAPSRLPSLRDPQGPGRPYGNLFSSPITTARNQSPGLELQPEKASTSTNIEVVEEKGPVCYDNDLEGDEDEEQGSDYDDDDMTYPGDPLHLSDPLHFSDYEEGNFEDGDDY